MITEFWPLYLFCAGLPIVGGLWMIIYYFKTE